MNKDRNEWWPIDGYTVALFIILLLLALIRIRFSPMPYMCDEGEYAYMGNLILHGGVPYRDAYNMKLPGTFGMYALFMTLFGNSPTGVHTGFMILSLLTIVVFYAAFRKLFSPLVAVVAVAIYGLMSVSLPVYGFAAHATHFLNFFLAFGLWFYARFVDDRNKLMAFFAGLMLGLAFLMKQQGAALIIGVSIAFITSAALIKPVAWKRLAAVALLYSAGVIIPYLLVLIVVSATGSFHQFWFWTVQYADVYVNEMHVGWKDLIHTFFAHFLSMYRQFEIVWWMAIAGLVLIWISKYDLQRKVFVISFALLSFASVWPGYYFRTHYFVLMFPAAGLLAGIFLELLTGLIPRGRYKVVASGLLPLMVLLAIGIKEVSGNWLYYYSGKMSEVSRMAYGGYQYFELEQVGNYIAAHSNAGDKIAILGSDPEIMVYANRQSATGYIYVYPLFEYQRYNREMQQEMITQITAARPRYIVCDCGTLAWQPPDMPHDIINWYAPYLASNYDLVGSVESSFSEDPSHVYWNEANNPVSPNAKSIKVFRSK